MGTKTLVSVDTQRDFGVLIICGARFNEHLYAQVYKANKMLGFIRCTISISEQYLRILRSLYTARVRSHHDYASEIWKLRSVSMIKLVEGVQRRATRILLTNLSYNEWREWLDLLPLVYRREVSDFVTFYKLKCGPYNFIACSTPIFSSALIRD